MGYSDQKYFSRPLTGAGTLNGTATASGTNALTGSTDLKAIAPNYTRKTVVNLIEVKAQAAPAANWTALTFIAKNGTATVGSISNVGTFTAGQTGTLTATVANSTFTAGSGLTYVLDGTGTASGQSFGTLRVDVESQELYA